MGDKGAWRTERGTYERPTQNWVCGWAREGHHCRWGPSPDGRCLAIGDCVPRKDGDRWQCTRPDEAGGPCATGPGPDGGCGFPGQRCQPVRSHRALRGLITRWVTIMTFGLLTVGFIGPWQHGFVSTGELSVQHAATVSECTGCHVSDHMTDQISFPHGPDIGECAACHDDDYPEGLASVPAAVVATNMSDKCISCHDLGADGHQPHSLARSKLERMTQTVRFGVQPQTPLILTAARSMPGVNETLSGQIACASCHREHRGTDAGLREWSNDRCQVCHRDSFASFENGHRDLLTYPYSGRTGIIFDHARHRIEHFQKTKRAFDCTGCHTVDAAGQRMTVGSFEQTCVDCHGSEDSKISKKTFHHGEQIIGGDPVALFTLPRLDLKTIETAGAAIGAWPVGAKPSRIGLTRLGLTPFTELLLATEPDTVAAIGRLKQTKTKLASLKRASGEDMADVETVIKATKRLLADLADDAAGTLQYRLERELKRPLTRRQLAALTGQLPQAMVQDAVAAWFPAGLTGTERDPARSRDMEPNATPELPGVNWIRTGTWQRDKYSLQYSTSGHEDDFIRAWLNICLELIQHGDSARELEGDSVVDAATRLFDELADSDAKPGEAKGAGRCTKCHSRTAPGDGGPGMIWTVRRMDWGEPEFTRFSHAPHLPSAQVACQGCHQPVPDNESEVAKSKYLEGFLDEPDAGTIDTVAMTGNFAPMGKQNCGECHAPKAAGDGCLVCHNYHAVRPSN